MSAAGGGRVVKWCRMVVVGVVGMVVVGEVREEWGWGRWSEGGDGGV